MTETQHWRLAITPLSPVHMGAGQDYEPTGYVIDDGALFEFEGIAALKALPKTERDRLGRVLDGRPTPDMLREVQRFFYENRQRLIAVSRGQIRVNQTVEAFYQERVGRVAQHDHGGGRVQNRLEIERTAYNPPTGQAILPGSGLKGAMRTALLDAVNAGKPLPSDLTRERRANQKLQEQLFRYRMGHLENDPMRLVHVADAALQAPGKFATEVRFAVNRKKQPVRRDGRLVESKAEQQGLYQLLECVPAMQPRAFEGSLSVQGTGDVESTKWPRDRFRLPEIAAACNHFYRPILERELSLLAERGYVDEEWAAGVRDLVGGPLASALSENRAWLLRVGRHSGAESVTLDGVRNIKIMKGKGDKPELLDHSKTLWLASDERLAQRHLLPFGWLLVEPYREDSDLPRWPGMELGSPLAQWKAAVATRRAALRRELEEAEKQEEERRAAAEAARREEAERAERLASLSAEGRKLEELRALLARDRAANRKEAGGELANRLVVLLKEAEETWTGPECRELADLALEIYGFIGWPASKKKRQRQDQIEAVRRRVP
jgi:CRISPR-associated protein Csm5